MLYPTHPDLPALDPGALIWRFLDLAKFLDLLQSNELHFRRCDCFDDPYEGMMPADVELSVTDPARRRDLIAHHAQRRADYYASCWHLADVEPAGMWKVYAGADGGGVAIQSTCGRLQAALDARPYPECHLCLVQYPGPPWNPERPASDLFAVLSKRVNFTHEREVRALVRLNGAGGIGRNVSSDGEVRAMPVRDPISILHHRLPVDVGALVTGVVISPAAPTWWLALVRRLVARLGHDISVTRSELYELKDASDEPLVGSGSQSRRGTSRLGA